MGEGDVVNLVQMQATAEAVEYINARYRDGLRLGVGGPLIRGTSIDYPPAMMRSDGMMCVVVEHGMKRHRLVKFRPTRTLTLVEETS